jgi:hypothetical protein
MRSEKTGFRDKSKYETNKDECFWLIVWYSIGRDLSYLLGWGGLAPQGNPFTSLILSGLIDLSQIRGHRSY